MTPSLLDLPAGCRVSRALSARRGRVRCRAGDHATVAGPRGALLAAPRCGAGAVTADDSAPMIEARGLTKRFVKAPDLAARASGWLGAAVSAEVVHAVDNVSLSIGKGEVVGLVGEFGLRQVDARAHDRGPARAKRGPGAVQGRRPRQARRRRGQGRPPRRADDLPGPLLVAQSAHAGGGDRRRGTARARTGLARRAHGLPRRHPRAGRPRPRLQAPLPAPVLGRPAQPHRHRPRARRASRSSWSATRPSPRSTSRSRRRSSICSWTCAEPTT